MANGGSAAEPSDISIEVTAFFVGVAVLVWLYVLFSTPTFYFWVAVGAVVGLALSFSNLRAARTFENVPTSKIHAAAQGYVEVSGKAQPAFVGSPPLHPVTRAPCTWWRLEVAKKASFVGDPVWLGHRDSNSGPFTLTDDTGTCLVDPSEAARNGTRRSTTYGESEDPIASHPQERGKRDRYRFEVESLPLDLQLIALGGFRRLDEMTLTKDAPDLATIASDVLGPPPDGRPFILWVQGKREAAGSLRRDAISIFVGVIGLLIVAVGLERVGNALTRYGRTCGQDPEVAETFLCGISATGTPGGQADRGGAH